MGCMPTSLLACLIYPQKSVQHLSHKSVVAPATCVAHAPECRGTSGTRCGVSTSRRSDGQRGIVDMQRDRRDPWAQIPLEHRHVWCRIPLAHPWDAGHSLVWPAVAPAALTLARLRSAYPIVVLSLVR